MPDERIPHESYTPYDRGVPTASWDRLGFNSPADPTNVLEVFPGHQGAVSRGVVYAWRHSSSAQRTSAEYRETMNAVNKDSIPDAADIPLDRYL